MTRSMKPGAWLYDRKPFGALSVSGIISERRKIRRIDRGTSWRRDSNEYGKPEKVWEKGRIMVE